MNTPGSDSVSCQPLLSSSPDILNDKKEMRVPRDGSRMSMSSEHPTTPPSSDPRTINRARFELELEFVQSLANPFYLHSLAQQNILEQPAFINFLKYLLYFKEKDYARFIQSDTFICSPFSSHVHPCLSTQLSTRATSP